MQCRITPRRERNPCGYTMKISSMNHRLLIYDVKRTTKIDGMGPFNVESGNSLYLSSGSGKEVKIP